MQITFYKYQGAGNDFICIDDLAGTFPGDDHERIRRICDRHFGVGADGLILLRPSERNHFAMVYYNANGVPGSMCGNGGRCLLAFARDLGYVTEEQKIVFDASDGEHEGRFTAEHLVRLKMQDAGRPRKAGRGYFTDSGSPHHVEYVDNLKDVDVDKRGRALRDHEMYAPGGANVNFVKVEKDDSLSIRTYERGVEAETFACGTGSVASAMVHCFLGNTKDVFTINARGGKLNVSFTCRDGLFTDVWLEGPAAYVFKGEIRR